jgi:cytochrome P450
MPPTAAPPGPDSNVLAQTVAFHRDPLGFLRRHQEQFGDVFQIRLLTARPTFVVTDPESVRALLGADPERAHAGEARRAVLPFASTRSVFGGDAWAHRAARTRISPAFAPELMEARRGAIAAIAERHAAGWPLGRPFRLLSRVRTLCDEVFVRLVLGVRDEEITTELVEAIGRMLRTPGNPPVTLPGKGDGLIGEVWAGSLRAAAGPGRGGALAGGGETAG